MHPSFSFNSRVHRAPIHNYQQQSGQPIYNIGAPPTSTFGGLCMSHPNLLMNQQFTRSFASVVSCENNLGKRHHMDINKERTACHTTNSNNNRNTGFLNHIFKHFKSTVPSQNHQQPQTPVMMPDKEFEDFTHMPQMSTSPQTTCGRNNNNFYLPPTTNINMKMPIISVPTQTPKSANPTMNTHLQNGMSLMSSLFGTYPTTSKPKNAKCFNGSKYWKSRKRHNDNSCNLQKNGHSKERASIERDIIDDYCDITAECPELDVVERELRASTLTDAQQPSSSMDQEQPPSFEIFSLEEFPAIVKNCPPPRPSVCLFNRKSPTASPPSKRQEMNQSDTEEEEFVVLSGNASISTPSFIPKRITLCEKVSQIIKSPQKMLTATPPKSCLKQQRNRGVSECSDDFIVFESNSGDIDADETLSDEDDDCSETECESDDDEQACDDNEMSEDEDEMPLETQLDSGVEEKKVHFNLTPKVHVMTAWNYAYREARKGTCWTNMSTDRQRFKNRIMRHQKVLDPILNERLRLRIYNERFHET